MRRSVVCAVVLLVCVGICRPAQGQGQGQGELTWKWKEGETFYVETVSKVTQKLLVEDPRTAGKKKEPGKERNANDREIHQVFQHTTVLSYTTRKVEKDGSAVVVQKVEWVLLKSGDKLRGEVIKEDDSLVGAELVLHVKPTGEVTRVEGQKKLLEKLTARDTEKESLFAGALSEASLKKAANQALAFLPQSSGERKEKTWKRPAELALGAFGRLTVEHVYKYEGEGSGKDKDVAKISFTTDVKSFEPARARSKSPTAVEPEPATGTGKGKGISTAYQVERGTFKATEGKGTLEFNTATGRLVRATSGIQFIGDLTIKNVDNVYHTHLTQEQTAETKVMDKRPPKEVK
jgi:hypothetical protein